MPAWKDEEYINIGVKYEFGAEGQQGFFMPGQEYYMEKKRTKCEIYSRVVGFLTPVSQWNIGKKEEFKDRKTYDKQLEICKE